LILIGVISDTHGLLCPEAIEALRGSNHIIHAGDIGSPKILETLSAIAPVTAVRGNVDKAAWAQKLPETEVLEVAGISIYVLHDLARLDLKPLDSPSWSAATAMFPNKSCATESSISTPAAPVRAASSCQ
jgi:putative phosphoesterase